MSTAERHQSVAVNVGGVMVGGGAILKAAARFMVNRRS
jgi:hypothetical protein